jgi:teneurin
MSTLLNVGSLTTGPDGSVYVGDFNVVRKVTADGKVSTILQFG